MKRFLPRGCDGASRVVGGNRFLPRSGAPARAFVQVASVELEVDASTTLVEPAFATLLSLPLTTTGGDLLIWFSVAGGSNANVTPEYRLLLDGALLASAGTLLIVSFSDSAAVFWRVAPLAAGAHTVTAEFGKQIGSAAAPTLNVRPVTLPNREHASIVAAELVP